jgi:hypothetical protein
MITLNHSCGFFSCCSVRLSSIIQYTNKHKQLPEEINCEGQFTYYKRPGDRDITFKFFEHYKNDVPLEYTKDIPVDDFMFHYTDYRNVDYASILPFVKKYFEPTEAIKTLSNELITQYNIKPESSIVVYYRGTDKLNETKFDSYESYYNKLNEILKIPNNEHMQIIIQTDAAQFLDYMLEKLAGKNVIVIKENAVSYNTFGIHNENRVKSKNFTDIQQFFATILIIAKCKYIVCSSSNCSIWAMFYRGNANNIYQNLNYSWFSPTIL